MKPSITAVVCTFNRRLQLMECLAGLAGQSLPSDSYEILVVDNNSTDGTAAAVADFARKHPSLLVKYVHEAEQGLSVARNTGVREAAAEIVAFIDDDAVAGPDWLVSLLSGFADPAVMGAGGPVELRFLAEPPAWLTSKFHRWLGRLDLSSDTPYVASDGRWPFGLNMACRKEAWAQVGGFDKVLGRIGAGMLAGEETVFFKNLSARGGKVMMIPAAKVTHLIPAERLTKDYFIRLHEGLGTTKVKALGNLGLLKKIALAVEFSVDCLLKFLIYVVSSLRPRNARFMLARLYFHRAVAKIRTLLWGLN